VSDRAPWPLSRWIASAIGAVVVFTLAGVAGLRLAGYTPAEQERTPVVASCVLRFEDVSDGLVHVYDHDSGRLIATLEPGKDSFIRGVMRSMARERRARDLGMEEPFRLAQHADGSLILEDTAIEHEVNLVAFGPTNLGSFEKLLLAGSRDS
jgi:putative photosynthetic complex assembly protein